MDYDKLSDFDINKAVAEELYPDYTWCAVSPELDRGHADSVVAWEGGEAYIYDYCNNPSDAWPIIVENKIGIHWLGGVDGLWSARTVHTSIVKGKNPLKCAMIVFLMMQEDK